MSGPVSTMRPVPAARRWLRIPAAAAAAVTLLAGCSLLHGMGGQIPQFPSLARHPDRSLHGTVAYFADRTRCVRIVAAAGRPVKTVYCLPQMDVRKAAREGKEIGPQLVWLPGGRLEVTMFRMTPPPKPGAEPGLHKGWQKIIDVRTGKIQDVPAASVPATPNLTTHPQVSPSGQRIGWTSDVDGRVRITLTSRTGTRTLLSVQGPGEYTYRLQAAFWAPDWRWIAADDGRILIITPGRTPVTRVVTGESSQIQFSGERYSRFAVTADDLLTAGG